MREQTFPADRPVLVEHSYSPSVGRSFDTILRKELRQNKAIKQEVERYRRDYCVTDLFLSQLDQLAAQVNQTKLGSKSGGLVTF